MSVFQHKAFWIFPFVAFIIPAVIFGRHAIRLKDAARHWEERSEIQISDFGEVERLAVTVLSGPNSGSDTGAVTEPGLSLHLDIDGEIWLYDLGLSSRDDDNAMRSNASSLNVELNEVDRVFLSHRHRDHMGGVEAERSGRIDLEGVGASRQRAETLSIIVPPNALNMNGQPITEIFEPTILGEGIASLGPIRRALFIGTIDEQALVIDVRGHGLVAIVGCGHQTLERLRVRIEEVFGRKIAAVVGDLHYPVPEGRLRIAGIDAQRRLASGRGPFQPVDQEDVTDLLAWARTQGVALYLVGHDTHDSILGLQGIQALSVGETVTIQPR